MAGSGNLIRAYAAGYLDTRQTLELFAELLRTGAIWHLRCSALQTADALITAGYLAPDGKITDKGRALIQGLEGSPRDANPEMDGASGEPIPGPFAVPNIPEAEPLDRSSEHSSKRRFLPPKEKDA
jgi:hypothetical protein